MASSTAALPSPSLLERLNVRSTSSTGGRESPQNNNRSRKSAGGNSELGSASAAQPIPFAAIPAKPGADSRSWVDFAGQFFPTFNSLLVQFKMDSHQVFLPKETLSASAGRSVQETIAKHQTMTSSPSSPVSILGFSLPSLAVENVSHRPLVQQFLNSLPVQIPESVWSTRRANLPWTVVLDGFSLFSLEPCSVARTHLLGPVSTSCTVGLSVKDMSSLPARSGRSSTPEDPEDVPRLSVALAVHADMSPIKVRVREEELLVMIRMMENSLEHVAKACPHLLGGGGTGAVAAPKAKTQVREDVHDEEEAIPVSSKPAAAAFDVMSDTAPSLLSEAFDSESAKGGDGGPQESREPGSIWVQWTVPQVSLGALAAPASGQEHLMEAVVEDCQTSFDWTPVYFKMKCRVSSAR